MRQQSRYRRDGFTTASIMAREDFRAEAGEVDVVFVVTEGLRKSSRRLRFEPDL